MRKQQKPKKSMKKPWKSIKPRKRKPQMMKAMMIPLSKLDSHCIITQHSVSIDNVISNFNFSNIWRFYITGKERVVQKRAPANHYQTVGLELEQTTKVRNTSPVLEAILQGLIVMTNLWKRNPRRIKAQKRKRRKKRLQRRRGNLNVKTKEVKVKAVWER